MQDQNYDVSVFVIDMENNYIELEEYKAYGYDNGVFVCLTNDELNSDCGMFNNSICIYKHWQIEVNEAYKEFMKYGVEYYQDVYCKWQDVSVSIPHNERFCITFQEDDDDKRNMQLKQYLDGYLSCQNIMSNVPSLLKKGETIQKYIPAIMIAHYIEVKHDGKFYNGYLPAIGQLLYITKNVNKVNDVFKTLGLRKDELFKVDDYTKELSDYWWSSSEYNYNYAWYLNYGNTDHYYKMYGGKYVLPLFAL